MPIFLYSRVSHQSSADSGISIESQIEQGIDYAASVIPQTEFSSDCFGSELPGVFIDRAVSGWSKPFTGRPAGRYMDSLLNAGDHVICYSIDRLARNIRDFANTTFYWQQKGVNIHYISDQINTSTAFGKLQANIKASCAQFTSDLISERTREALAIRRMTRGRTALSGKRETRLWIPSEYTVDAQVEANRPSGTIYRYERVSSDKQYTSGLGLEYQSQMNAEAAERLSKETGGVVYPKAFVDPAVSAFSQKFSERPSGRQLLDIVKPGDDIIVYRLDRAWRNPADAIEMCEELKKRGVYIHLVSEGIRTDSGVGMEWIGMLASMAHMESMMRSRRVREAHSKCRKQGRPIGAIKAGFKEKKVGVKSKVVLDKKACARLAAIYIMRMHRNYSNDQIRDVLASWDARHKEVKLTLLMRKNISVARSLQQLEDLKSHLPEEVYGDIIQSGWELLRQPIRKEHWTYPKWEFEPA